MVTTVPGAPWDRLELETGQELIPRQNDKRGEMGHFG